ncbi:MAG: AIR synthase related protein, partial [Gemmatimonadota bacterium]|nr:AIR synthase related protein [Gemmatimonadota bacterium]
EAARNIACTGAVPLGITDCLNFGNPERPEIFFQFKEACRGIADACRAFNTPVTGGNVSLYNESPTGAIDPTPTVGMVGLLEKLSQKVGSHFQQAGDRILVLGETTGALGGSAYWSVVRDFVGGHPAAVDLHRERALQHLLVEGARRGLVRSAHDCSAGGLAVALAEAAMGGPYSTAGFGATVDLGGYAAGVDDIGVLYGEDHARVVISCRPGQLAAVTALAGETGVPVFDAGEVGTAGGAVVVSRGASRFSWMVDDLRDTFFSAIPRRMSHVDEDRAAA